MHNNKNLRSYLKISLKRGNQMMTRKKTIVLQQEKVQWVAKNTKSTFERAHYIMERLCLKISKMMPFEMFRREPLVGSKYSQAFLKSKYHINLKKKVLRVLLTGSERTQQYSSVPGYTGSSTPVFSQHRQGGDRG